MTRKLDQVEVWEMRQEHRKMRAALFKVMDLYAKAPGHAAPIPTTKLVWGMYKTALKAFAEAAPR